MRDLQNQALRRLGVLAGLVGVALAVVREPAEAVAAGALAAIVLRIAFAVVPAPRGRLGRCQDSATSGGVP